jgi:hypothetical protein
MRLKEVEFTDDEKNFMQQFIVLTSLSDDRVYNRKGHEFEFTKDNLLFLSDMILYTTIELMEEPEFNEPPDVHGIKSRSVILFTYSLLNDGEEVKTNLDYNFEESVKKELTI